MAYLALFSIQRDYNTSHNNLFLSIGLNYLWLAGKKASIESQPRLK